MEVIFRREVQRVKHDGATVLLSSHIMSEVEQLCDHVSIIRSGRIIETGTLAQLRHLTQTEVSFDAVTGADYSALSPAGDLDVADARARFTVDSAAVPGVLPELARLNVSGLRIEPPSLEELFLRHYDSELHDSELQGSELQGSELHDSEPHTSAR